jgi:hypothetical protein
MCNDVYTTFGFLLCRDELWNKLDLKTRQEATQEGSKQYNKYKPFGDIAVDAKELICWRLSVIHKNKKPKKPLAPSNAADTGQSQGISEKVVRAYDADDCR